MNLHPRSTSADIALYTREQVRQDTAAHKLLLLGLPALLRLFTAHLQLRAMREPLDPDALERTAHHLNDLATEARRQKMTAREVS